MPWLGHAPPAACHGTPPAGPAAMPAPARTGPAATSRPAAPRLRELLGWGAARERAQETLELMSMEQKTSLLQGSGWEPTKWWYDLPRFFYVGNTPAMPELGIPSLNMQDATDGFRPYWGDITGTATVWPSVLAMAATWDPTAVQDWAVAVGQEFHGKGANVILGPGVQVQRVARCGRSFEYLSGDDPYLGAVLSRAYVHGVQSQGVMAIMKHWVFNSQENPPRWLRCRELHRRQQDGQGVVLPTLRGGHRGL